jgi:VWFA-related protein
MVAALLALGADALAERALGAEALAQVPQQAPPTPAEQPPLTFRVEANLIEVDAYVTDAAGNPVTGLTAADFQLLEDGKPQNVSAFAQVNIPVARAERPLFSPSAIEPDVQTNSGFDGRVYLFVLDDLHVDITRTPRVKSALHRFFERSFGTNDVAAVVFTGGRAIDAQDFTSSARLLLNAVDRFTGRKMRSSTLERLDEYNRLSSGGLRRQGDPISDPRGFERGRDARSTMQSLQKLSEFMAGLHGRRKTMVFVSEGIDYDIYNLLDNNSVASDIVDATRNAVAAATRGNVSIYAIDPRGLTTPGDDLIETSGVPIGEPGLGLGITSSLDEVRLSQDSLRTLADETGGFAVVNQNDFNDAFDRIVRDSSAYYVLGYITSNDRRDGKFRKIEVRVTRPGLTVRARRGYVAPRGRAAAPARASNDPIDAALKTVVESPLPVAGMPMRIFAAPYKGAPPNAAVAIAVELGIDRLRFVEQNGTFNDKLTVIMTAVDADAKVRANERSVIDLAFRPETFARAQARGFRLTSVANLPPGRYQLRVSAADSAGIAGSVIRDLEVPDFYKQPLAMSGLTLVSAAGNQTPTAKVKDDPVGLLLMRPPTTAREFTRDDELTLFAEVYENQRNVPPHKIDLATEVRAEGGRVVFRNREERSSTELQGSRGGFGYALQIPLKDFSPGLYVIHVEGKSRGLNDEAGVGRDVQITVR